MSVCARVLAAALMAGAIAVALAFPALVGRTAGIPRVLTAPPITGLQTVHVPAVGAQSSRRSGLIRRAPHARPLAAGPAPMAVGRVMDPTPVDHASAPAPPSARPPTTAPVPVTEPAAAPAAPSTTPAASQSAPPVQPPSQTRQLATEPSPTAAEPLQAPPPSTDQDDENEDDGGHGHGRGHDKAGPSAAPSKHGEAKANGGGRGHGGGHGSGHDK
jgi:hypothetical protein